MDKEAIAKMRITEYYEHYLLLHKHPKCRLLHYIGQWVTIFFIIWSLTYNWYMIAFSPLIVYPFAWSGHYFFERNKPAAFKNPLMAKLSDWMMFRDILFGKISIW